MTVVHLHLRIPPRDVVEIAAELRVGGLDAETAEALAADLYADNVQAIYRQAQRYDAERALADDLAAKLQGVLDELEAEQMAPTNDVECRASLARYREARR